MAHLFTTGAATSHIEYAVYPQIQCIQDLDAVIETFSPADDTVQYTTFHHFTNDDIAFFGQISKAKQDITLGEFVEALEQAPDHTIFPPKFSGDRWTIAARDTGDELYIKRPLMSNYEAFKDNDFLAQMLLDEALAFERIARRPHRNIIRYYGIRVRRGLITGLVLEKHQHNLSEHIKQGNTIDKEAFMQALTSAVEHIHSLGMAHNDLNPENIMVDADCMPVVIDFGSCRLLGKRLLSGSTVGWIKNTSMLSTEKHDISALEKIGEWIENPWYDWIG